MTAPASASAAPPSRRDDWLFGPASDIVLGCGLGSIVVIGFMAASGALLPTWVPASILILGLTVPHYGATLLRVYEDGDDRRHYSFFAVWCSLLIAILLVLGLKYLALGSLILTVYLTWSPWHYSGQNYGIFVMMLARRGVRIDASTKRIVHATFVLSYAMTFLALHGAQPDATYAPVTYQGTVFRALPLGIPAIITNPLLFATSLAYLIAVGTVLKRARENGGLRAWGPSLAMGVTQLFWFALPVLVRAYAGGDENPWFASAYTAYGFVWIAAFHSAQYLWITTYYAAGQRPAGERLRFLGKSAVTGYAIWTVPALLLGPAFLGSLPHENGLALLAAAIVNLHHFVLDGAIWKLREGRVARLLLTPRRAEQDPAAPIAPSAGGTPWLRRSIYTVGTLCVLYGGVTFYEEEFGFERAIARRDLLRASVAVDRLEALGRESASRRRRLGEANANQRQHDAAFTHFEQSLAIFPTRETYASLARLHIARGEDVEARAHYDALLERWPDDAEALFRSGLVLMRLNEPVEAEERLERAQQLAPDVREIESALRRASIQARAPAR